MEKDRIVKITRTLIRLKHALKADEEINDVLTSRLDEFDEGIQSGELKHLKAGVEDILGDV